MKEPVTIRLETTFEMDFACHVENGEIIIDECKNCDPLEALSLFEPWMLGLEK